MSKQLLEAHRIPKERVKQFMLAGRATITFLNELTGVHRTFKVKYPKIKGTTKIDSSRWWILYDNEYIGTIRAEGYVLSAHHKRRPDPQHPGTLITFHHAQWPAFIAIWQRVVSIGTLNEHWPDTFKVYHMGACGLCGRDLTDPDSIALGFGPECRKRLQL